jgi:hypothetical protein
MSGKPYKPGPRKVLPNSGLVKTAPPSLLEKAKEPVESQLRAPIEEKKAEPKAVPAEAKPLLGLAKAVPAEAKTLLGLAKAVPAVPKEVRKLRVKTVEKPLPTFETEASEFKPADRYKMDEDDLTKLSEKYPETKTYVADQETNETKNPYHTDTKIYMPPTRRAFNTFIQDTYMDIFALPPLPDIADPDACQKLYSSTGEDGVKAFLYQKFIREYIRNASPYRGILVYHGLGSGKTCSAISAAEALFGTSNKKIIVMTPASLRGNFINEITFCGFRHFSFNNNWIKVKRDISKSPTLQLYMQSVLSLSDIYVKRIGQREDRSRRAIWLPDFSKTAEGTKPYSDLTAEEQSDIREQVLESINNRIKFINYNGISRKELLEYACNTDEKGNRIFDNAVIVIDEIHNLVRSMQGKLIQYLVKRGKRVRRYEPEDMTVDKWNPLHCGDVNAYNRPILFYKLLCDARNSKVIGLSGTPLINFPEEIGILSNLLAGYINCAEFYIATTDRSIINRVQEIADKDPRIDMVISTVGETGFKILISVFPEGYAKVNDDKGNFLGVKLVEDAQENVKEVFARLSATLKASGIPIRLAKRETIVGDKKQTIEEIEVKFIAYPRLPIDEETFRGQPIGLEAASGAGKRFVSGLESATGASRSTSGVFVNSITLDLNNEDVLKKRLTGLISYYKGSKDDYMPRANDHGVTKCPMSSYLFGKYTEVRKEEITKESTKDKEGGDVFATVELFSKKGVPSSYRFRSRAVCNFAFPKGIDRPFPNDADIQKELGAIDETQMGEAEVDPEKALDEEEEASVVTAKEEDKLADTLLEEEEKEEEEGESSLLENAAETLSAGVEAVVDAVAKQTEVTTKSYTERVNEAMKQLNANRGAYFSLDTTLPVENQLATYSPKLAIMLQRINDSPGSNLVYSQFKTVEGLGVLSIALKANGYKEIKLIEDPYTKQVTITDDSIASLMKGPGAEKRFITFTGEGTRNMRSVALNIFNGNFDKLPPAIKTVFLTANKGAGETTYETTKNKYGEICWVIAITGAGAEGISLKCVRGVHIYEPYWNMVRLEQVKGRAIRICSHADLPYEERTVDIYTYVTVFSNDQTPDQTILRTDGSQTSDEKVLVVSMKKEEINRKLIDVLKESAVDCALNYSENGGDITCFTIEGKETEYMFHPNLIDDIQITATGRGAIKKEIKEASTPALSIAPETGKLLPKKAQTLPLVVFKGANYIVDDITIGNPLYDPSIGPAKVLYMEKDVVLKNPVFMLSVNPLTGAYRIVKKYGDVMPVAPKVAMVAPKVAIEAPKVAIVAPKVAMVAPKVAIEAPKVAPKSSGVAESKEEEMIQLPSGSKITKSEYERLQREVKKSGPGGAAAGL